VIAELDRYAATVLAAYGITLVLLAWMVFISWRRAIKVKAELARVEQQIKGKTHGTY
jgi:heme exporter protein D